MTANFKKFDGIKNDNFQDDIRNRIKKFRNIIKTYLYNNI